MPPLVGPSTVECWTRYPAKISIVPSSRRSGTATITARSGKFSRSATICETSAYGSACSNWGRAIKKSRVSHPRGGAGGEAEGRWLEGRQSRRSLGRRLPEAGGEALAYACSAGRRQRVAQGAREELGC